MSNPSRRRPGSFAEAHFVIDRARLVRIEIRQRRHADDFGGLYVHHQAGRADCTEFFHGDREFVFQHVLNPISTERVMLC